MSYEERMQLLDSAIKSIRDDGIVFNVAGIEEAVAVAREADAEIARLSGELKSGLQALQDTENEVKELEARLAGAMGVVEAALAFKKHEQEINHHDFKEHVLRRLELLDALYGAALAAKAAIESETK